MMNEGNNEKIKLENKRNKQKQEKQAEKLNKIALDHGNKKKEQKKRNIKYEKEQ